MAHEPRRVLVTGGAGFIGSHLVRHLLGRDARARVINVDALRTGGSLQNLRDLPDPGRHLFVHGDVGDRALVDRLLREHGVDTVVHLAAETHVDRSIADPLAFVRANVDGTASLLEACRAFWLGEEGLTPGAAARARRFHQVSTDEVYGSLGPDEPPADEARPHAPNSPYAASKAAADDLVRAWSRTYGLPVTTTISSNNYGPRQHGEKLVPTVIRCCLARTPIPVYGDGLNLRDWLHVEDHCRAIDLVLRHGRVGERYNVGAGAERRNLDLVRLICAGMDRLRPEGAPHERLIAFVADRPGHDRRYAVDWRRLRDELGWTPAIPLEEGLTRLLRSTAGWGPCDP